MNCFADAASVRRGGCRQGQRAEVSHERYEQEEFGDQSLGDQSIHAGSAMLEAYQLAVDESKKGSCAKKHSPAIRWDTPPRYLGG